MTSERKVRLYEGVVKRLVDVSGAGIALFLMSPVLAVVAAIIRIEDGGPVFFTQTRAGRDGQPFRLLKFRSMPERTAEVPSASAGELKVTHVGAILRRTNIDELPQLINILRGEMSLVGPRPALPSQKELLALRSRGRSTSLRPGLTGLAQINSYDGMPTHEKAMWDDRYAGDVRFIADSLIVFRTFRYILRPPPRY